MTKTVEDYKQLVQPEQIMKEVLDAAAAHAAATQMFTQKFMFYGKPLSEWSDELAVPIAKGIQPEGMRDLYVKLANNIQVASHFHSVASTINSTLVGGGQIKHSDLVKAIVDSYLSKNATRPAASIIDEMAKSYMRDTTSTRVASKIVKDFWKQKLDALVEVRKCLEQVGISIHSEMKYLQNNL